MGQLVSQKIKIKLATLTIFLLTTASGAAGCFTTAFQPHISRIEVDSTNVTIEGAVLGLGSNKIYLAELLPHQPSNELSQGKIIQEIDLDSSGQFRIELTRWTPTNDRILSRFFLTNQEHPPFHATSNLMWASDVASAAVYPDLKEIKAKSIKGLGGIRPDPRLFPDLAELGVGHITVNITLNSLLRPNPVSQIQHRHGDYQFKFNAVYVQQLDQVMKFAHQNGIIVSAIILVPRIDQKTDLGRILVHPDATDGHYTLANVTSEEGVRHYNACMRFLAERYGPVRPHTVGSRIGLFTMKSMQRGSGPTRVKRQMSSTWSNIHDLYVSRITASVVSIPRHKFSLRSRITGTSPISRTQDGFTRADRSWNSFRNTRLSKEIFNGESPIILIHKICSIPELGKIKNPQTPLIRRKSHSKTLKF